MTQFDTPYPKTLDCSPEVLPTLDWRERVLILNRDFGFLPTTMGEVNRAFMVAAFKGQPGDTGAHLNEILLRQKNFMGKPASTVGAVVREMGYYRADAEARRLALSSDYHKLREVNPELDVSLLDDLSVLGRLSVAQYDEISEGMNKGDSRPLDGSIKKIGNSPIRLVTRYDVETHDELLTQMLFEARTDRSVLAVRGLVLAAGKAHRNRRDFWTAHLEASRSHAVARPIVKELLGK